MVGLAEAPKEIKVVRNVMGLETIRLPGGIVARRAITRRRVGPYVNLQLGVSEMEPGVEEYIDGTIYGEEVNYILQGEITFTWDGGQVTAKAGDAVWFPPYFKYTMKNTGREKTVFVYVITPPVE
ncbi:MAG: hypothetical protein DRJ62_07510 [Thermoprotei archaeon]|nr:MAG: hypothetical protein DRJ62_07510 [Thermoprotei archaeon]